MSLSNCRVEKVILRADDPELFSLLMLVIIFASLEPSVIDSHDGKGGIESGNGERGPGKYS